jgi:circadian clock protein KaiC
MAATLSTPLSPTPHSPVASTGIDGLDEILRGGLPRDRVYLLDGEPGTGKTTAALQFLLEGRKHHETCLYVTLSETADELAAVAASHHWSLDGVVIFELTPSEVLLGEHEQYTIFDPSEVELSDTIKAVVQQVQAINPARVVIDSLAEFRLLSGEAIRYRRQILALKQFFIGRHSTVLLLDDRSSQQPDLQVQSIAHGVIRLEQRFAEYGEERRRIHVAKLRGVKYRGGYHDVRIDVGGLRVFPRIVAADHDSRPPIQNVSSGIAPLDRLLGGGLDTGTSALVIGPAGVGKTVLASRYVAEAARNGLPGAVYLFDERLNTFMHRSAGLGLELPALVDQDLVTVRRLNPGAITPGEFAAAVRAQVEHEGVKVLLLDSVNGYLSAMQEESAVLVQLHELLSYLNHRGVLTLVTVAQSGVLGSSMAAPLDVSYLADTVVMMRYFEAGGAVRKAISVVKKRTGPHEDVIREFRIDGDALRVGEPLTAFRGVLTGVPEYLGKADPLFGADTRAESR